jgi:hypothetical protein
LSQARSGVAFVPTTLSLDSVNHSNLYELWEFKLLGTSFTGERHQT